MGAELPQREERRKTWILCRKWHIKIKLDNGRGEGPGEVRGKALTVG